MSNLVFPVLRSLEWDVERTPGFSTSVQKAKSGRRVAVAEQSIPLHTWTMSVSVLDKSKIQVGQIYNDFARLEGFFKQLLGSYDSFLYEDPTDYLLTAENIGTGDGVKTGFQVTRDVGGYKEAVYDIEPSPALQVFVSDWEGNQLQYSTPRTNFLLRSADFTNASWGKTNANVTATGDTTLAPDGTTTADTLTDNDAAVDVLLSQTFAVPNDSATYTGSVFVKAGTSPVIAIRLSLTVGGTPVNTTIAFNPSTGQFSASNLGTAPVSVSVVAAPNGFWRVGFSITNNSTGNTTLGMSIRPYSAAALAGNGLGFTTAHSNAGTGTVIAWGAQFEAGSLMTSYIPTVAAQVTVTDYSINSTALITFAVAPLNLAVVTVTGEFYWRCVFTDDALPFNLFSNNLWEAKTIAFEQLRP